MKPYIGVKQIRAKAMTREEYNELRGWTVPADENPDDAGYLVEYVDGGKANTEQFKGYVSWSPKDVFERAYREVGAGMTFGLAIEAMKAGSRVARMGWNGKGMWLILSKIYTHTHIEQGGINANYVPFIIMKTVSNEFVPWLASQTDIISDDWEVLE